MAADNPLLAYGAWLSDARDAWPDAALEAARNAFIDTIGVAIPGAAEPVTRKVLAAVRGWGDGRCTVIGSDSPCHTAFMPSSGISLTGSRELNPQDRPTASSISGHQSLTSPDL